MTPDAKIFCELLSVEDESWQDCVEACLGDRRFDILVPPAHYAAAKSAFVALRDKVGPISLLDTPSIRTANRKADAAPADSLAAQVRSENPLAAQYADTILRRIVCCDTPDTLENYPDSATRDLLRHHPFRLKKIDDIGFCQLTSKDVVRHPLVQQIVQAYDAYEKKQKPERPARRRNGVNER